LNLLNSVEGEVCSSFSGCVELNPHGDGQLGVAVQAEGNDQTGRARLGIVGEVEIVVNLLLIIVSNIKILECYT